MKKKHLIIFSFILHITTFSLFANTSPQKTKNWEFAMSPNFGISFGSLGEYLYSQYDTNLLVSDLQWNFSPLLKFGIKAQYNYKLFFVEGSFSYFLPTTCSKMYDSDYNKDFKTNLCFFENKSIFAIDTSVKASFKIPIKKIFLTPSIIGTYSANNFVGFNGYGFFGDKEINGGWTETDVPWDNPNARKAASVSNIEYTRDELLLFLGTEIEYKIKRFTICVGIFVSPITYTNVIDFHTDQTGNTPGYKAYSTQYAFFSKYMATLDFNFNLNTNVSIFINTSGIFSLITKGILVTNYGRQGTSAGIFNEQKQYYLSKQQSGSDIKKITIDCGMKFSF